MNGKHLTALAAALCTLATACGGDDSSDDSSPASSAPTSTSTEAVGTTSTSPGTSPSTDPGTSSTTGETDAPTFDADATIRTIGAAPPPGSWDPATTLNPTQDVQYFTFVYDTLLRLDEDSKLAPQLATAWEYDTTQTVLTLTLRDDVTFTDGSQFTADVAKLNLDRVRNGTGGAARLLAGITSIDAASPTELVITQAGPNAKLLSALASPAAAMASAQAIENPEALAQAPVGSGPYVLDEADQGSVTFVRKDDYWNSDIQFAARHVITGATDGNARMNAVLSGTADVAELSQTAPTPDLLARVDDGSLVMSTAPGSVSAYGINNTVAPFDNPKVIQAVNLAIDRDTYNSLIYNDLCEPTGQVFLPGQAGYIEGLEYEYDPDQARQLLAEAGVGEVTVKFQTVAGAPTAPVELIQSMLAEVGITLDVTASPIQEVLPNFFSGQFGMSILALFQAMPDSSYTTDFLTGRLNPGTKDPALVAMVDAANALAPDDPARNAAYEEINRFVYDNPVMVPICQLPHTMVAQPNVVGIDDIHDNDGGRYAYLGVTE